MIKRKFSKISVKKKKKEFTAAPVQKNLPPNSNKILIPFLEATRPSNFIHPNTCRLKEPLRRRAPPTAEGVYGPTPARTYPEATPPSPLTWTNRQNRWRKRWQDRGADVLARPGAFATRVRGPGQLGGTPLSLQGPHVLFRKLQRPLDTRPFLSRTLPFISVPLSRPKVQAPSSVHRHRRRAKLCEKRDERNRGSKVKKNSISQKMSGGDLQLPPGFRFHPTDEELVMHYLCRKSAGLSLAVPIIAEIDLYKYDPWELPGNSEFSFPTLHFFQFSTWILTKL